MMMVELAKMYVALPSVVRYASRMREWDENLTILPVLNEQDRLLLHAIFRNHPLGEDHTRVLDEPMLQVCEARLKIYAKMAWNWYRRRQPTRLADADGFIRVGARGRPQPQPATLAPWIITFSLNVDSYLHLKNLQTTAKDEVIKQLLSKITVIPSSVEKEVLAMTPKNMVPLAHIPLAAVRTAPIYMHQISPSVFERFDKLDYLKIMRALFIRLTLMAPVSPFVFNGGRYNSDNPGVTELLTALSDHMMTRSTREDLGLVMVEDASVGLANSNSVCPVFYEYQTPDQAVSDLLMLSDSPASSLLIFRAMPQDVYIVAGFVLLRAGGIPTRVGTEQFALSIDGPIRPGQIPSCRLGAISRNADDEVRSILSMRTRTTVETGVTRNTSLHFRTDLRERRTVAVSEHPFLNAVLTLASSGENYAASYNSIMGFSYWAATLRGGYERSLDQFHSDVAALLKGASVLVKTNIMHCLVRLSKYLPVWSPDHSSGEHDGEMMAMLSDISKVRWKPLLRGEAISCTDSNPQVVVESIPEESIPPGDLHMFFMTLSHALSGSFINMVDEVEEDQGQDDGLDEYDDLLGDWADEPWEDRN